MPVISMQPYGQLGGALIGAGIGFGISPLAQAGLDEPFGLAVGLRRVRLGADVLEAEVSASLSEIEGSVARSEEHTSELQSLMRISYAVFCLKKKKTNEDKRQKN